MTMSPQPGRGLPEGTGSGPSVAGFVAGSSSGACWHDRAPAGALTCGAGATARRPAGAAYARRTSVTPSRTLSITLTTRSSAAT